MTLRGDRSDKLKGIIRQANIVLNVMEKVHSPWVDAKKAILLPYLQNDKGSAEETNRDLLTAYKAGLARTLTQEFKVCEAKSGKGFERITTVEGLENIIAAYTFDFYRILLVCRRYKLSGKTALKLAKLSYYHNPNSLRELDSDPEFAGLNLSIKVRGLVDHPKKSETEFFLQSYKEVVARLTVKGSPYVGLMPSVIGVAALFHINDPESFLQRYIKIVAKYSAEDSPYYGVNPSEIVKAALFHQTNPEKYLDKVMRRM